MNSSKDDLNSKTNEKRKELVMKSKKKDASFNAAAEGKLKVLGMSVYAQWFEDGIKLVM